MRSFSTFTIMWLGQFLSRLGSGMTAFALGVYVYRTGGGATGYSMVLFAAFLPPVLIAPLGGVIADRYDRLKVMWIGDLCSAAGVLAIATLVFKGYGSGVVLYTAIAATAVCGAFHGPAFKAAVSELVEPQDYGRAAGMIQLAEAARYLLSPVLASLCMAYFPVSIVLAGDAVTFVIGAVSVAFIGSIRSVSDRTVGEKTTPLRELLDGFRVLRSNRTVRPLLVVTSVVTFATGVLQALLGPLVLSHASTETFAWIQSIGATGMIVTSIVVSGIRMEYDRYRILRVSIASLGVFFIGIALGRSPVMVTIAVFFLFATLPVTNTNVEVLFRRAIQGPFEARTWAFVSFVTQIGLLFGLGTAGFAADLLASGPGAGAANGRAAATLIVGAGILLVLIAIITPGRNTASVREPIRIDT